MPTTYTATFDAAGSLPDPRDLYLFICMNWARDYPADIVYKMVNNVGHVALIEQQITVLTSIAMLARSYYLS